MTAVRSSDALGRARDPARVASVSSGRRRRHLQVARDRAPRSAATRFAVWASARAHRGRAVRARHVPRARRATRVRASIGSTSSATTEELQYERLRAEVATRRRRRQSVVAAAQQLGMVPATPSTTSMLPPRAPPYDDAGPHDEHARRHARARRRRALAPSRRPLPRPTARPPAGRDRRAHGLRVDARRVRVFHRAFVRAATVRVAKPLRRLGVCTMLVVIVFAALAFRVTQLQVLSGDHYRRWRSANDCAPSRSMPSAAASSIATGATSRCRSSARRSTPTRRSSPTRRSRASKLAPVVGVDQQTLYERLSDKSHRFVYIARTVDDATEQQVRELGLAGVAFVPESQRQYPRGAARVHDHRPRRRRGHRPRRPREPVRRQLQGTPGEVVVERDQQRSRHPRHANARSIAARRGTDMVLTHRRGAAVAGRAVAHRPGDGDRGEGRHGGRRRRHDRRRARDGDGRRVRPRRARARGASRGEATNRPLDRPVRAGLDEQAHHDRDRDRARATSARHTEFNVPPTICDRRRDLHRRRPAPSERHRRWSATDILRESSNVGTIEIAQHLVEGRSSRTALRDRSGSVTTTAVDFPGQPTGLLLDPDAVLRHRARVDRDRLRRRGDRACRCSTSYTTIANGGVTRPPRLARRDDRRERRAARGRRSARRPAGGLGADRDDDDDDARRRRPRRHRRVRGDSRVHGRGQDRNVAQGRVDGGYSRRDDGVVHRLRARGAPAARGDRGARRARDEYGRVAAAPVFSEIMQFALDQYRVARRRRRRNAAVRRRSGPTRRPGQQLHRAARRGPASASPNRPPPRPRPPGRSRSPGRVVERSGIGDARYPRRRHVPERLGGRVRLHDLLDGAPTSSPSSR